jgi:ABC-type antimicrobial peptide transport system permease subunit
MALGSQASDVVRLVVRRVVIFVAIGTFAGILVSLWLSQSLGALLYGIEPQDPATLVAAVIVLATVGVTASWAPVSRAARTDPAIVLREM